MELEDLLRFPCNAQKRPAVRGNWQTAAGKTDWTGWHLVGVPTGAANGFDVLDIDLKNGGDRWYDLNFDALPATQAHETQSAGLHLLFRHAEGVRNRGNVFPGVDVRGDGGYVIFWPAAGLPFEQHPICDWPGWLLEEIRRPRPANADTSKQPFEQCSQSKKRHAAPLALPRGRTEDRPAQRTRNRYARMLALLRVVEQAPQGKRNDALFFAACRMAEMVIESHGRSRIFCRQRRAAFEPLAALLREACSVNGLLAEDPGAVAATIASAFRRIEESPKGGGR
jgi:hypothetical protein